MLASILLSQMNGSSKAEPSHHQGLMVEYETERSQACEGGSPDDEAGSIQPAVEAIMLAAVDLGGSNGLRSLSDTPVFLST
jgi:hypothetical protein